MNPKKYYKHHNSKDSIKRHRSVHMGMLGMRLEALLVVFFQEHSTECCTARKGRYKKNYGKWRKIDGEKNLSFPWKNDSENCQQRLVRTTEP